MHLSTIIRRGEQGDEQALGEELVPVLYDLVRSTEGGGVHQREKRGYVRSASET